MAQNSHSVKVMKTPLRKVVLSLAILLILVSATPRPALASTKQSFSALLVMPPGGPSCDRIWIDEEGVIHARGCVQNGTIEGDLAGEVALTFNMNLLSVGETGPQDGVVSGKGTVSVDGGGGVSYRISVNVVFVGGEGTGKFVILGVGSFVGTHVVGMIAVSGDEPAELIGTLFTA